MSNSLTIVEFQSRHSDLVREVKQLLLEKEVSCSDFVFHITSQPTESIGEQYSFILRCIKDLTNTDEIMKKLSSHMHFTDCRLLKEIIFHFAKESHPGLLGKVEKYEADVEGYCRSTTVASFSGDWQGEEIVPDFFTTLQVKINLNSNERNLEYLEVLRKTLGKELGRCLRQQLVECAMVLFKVVELGSVAITWLIPSEIVPELMTAMTEPAIRELFISLDVIEVLTDGECCYTSSPDSDSNSFDSNVATLTPVRRQSKYTRGKMSAHDYSLVIKLPCDKGCIMCQ